METLFRPKPATEPSPEELAGWIGGRLVEPELAPERVTGLATLDEATETELSFAGGEGNLKAARASKAGLILSVEGADLQGRARLEVSEVWTALSEVMRRLYPAPALPRGVHPSAVVAEGAILGRDVAVGPLCYVGEGTELADGVTLGPHCAIDPQCRIGEGSRLFSGVLLQGPVQVGRRAILHSGVVLGADGFKYEQVAGGVLKIPQVGVVILEDDVEIGAGTTVDRAFLHETRIGQGTKIDNQVQIGHNCRIGRYCLIAGSAAIAGSVTIEDGCLIGGKVGIRDGITIGRGSMVVGNSGLAHDLEPGSVVMGYPAFPIREFQRSWAISRRLPEMARRLRALEKAAGRD